MIEEQGTKAMRIKIFSSSVESLVEERFRDWVREQGSMITIEEYHYSTAFDHGNSCLVYSLLVVYQNL